MPDSPILSAYDMPPVLSVAELNRLIRRSIEQVPLVWVAGEISNLTWAASGHLYFTLKDKEAQTRCTIWRNKANLLRFRPENGQKVEARALPTLYEARGEFQLNVETLRLAGQGRLFEQFLALKARLEAEGCFRAELKRPLPAFPQRLAIITSAQAAALRDVLTTLQRRAPQVALTLFATAVQGAGATAEIVRALAAASDSDCEAVILCRGGGSLEDLWCFNEESVARAIRACRLPVVTGIGHETDFTIADFVADLRAPTPTAAAELICPDREVTLARLSGWRGRLRRRMETVLMHAFERLDALSARLPSPARQLALHRERLQAQHGRLQRAIAREQEARNRRLSHLATRLVLRQPSVEPSYKNLARLRERLARAFFSRQERFRLRLADAERGLRQLDPHAVLQRGYALALDAEGRIVRDAAVLKPQEILNLKLAQGETQVQVTENRKRETGDARSGANLP